MTEGQRPPHEMVNTINIWLREAELNVTAEKFIEARRGVIGSAEFVKNAFNILAAGFFCFGAHRALVANEPVQGSAAMAMAAAGGYYARRTFNSFIASNQLLLTTTETHGLEETVLFLKASKAGVPPSQLIKPHY